MWRLYVSGSPMLPELDQELETRQLPPYKVVLHNDDVNSFDHVILTILKLTELDENEAVERTWEAHETGSAVLLITHRERAELYVEQFKSASLVATCEPDV